MFSHENLGAVDGRLVMIMVIFVGFTEYIIAEDDL